MKYTIGYLLGGKKLFFPSLFLGGSFAAVKAFLIMNTPSEIFGYSISVWFVALAVNIWDIYTGVQADVVRRHKKGERFQFNATKSWQAFEKVVGFSFVLFFLYQFEKESVRLHYPEAIAITLNAIKSIFFVYVILIELRSVGDNNEERFGKKGDVFALLDSIVVIVNKGLLKRVQKIVEPAPDAPLYDPSAPVDINENFEENEKIK